MKQARNLQQQHEYLHLVDSMCISSVQLSAGEVWRRCEMRTIQDLVPTNVMYRAASNRKSPKTVIKKKYCFLFRVFS
jgi:hypothetical protein